MSPWKRALAVFFTYHFVCFTWIFFRASSLTEALTVLGRLGSLTWGVDNISRMFLGVLALAAIGQFIAKKWYSTAIEVFARQPFYVHAAALFLVVLALQHFGGRGSSPFVYSRF